MRPPDGAPRETRARPIHPIVPVRRTLKQPATGLAPLSAPRCKEGLNLLLDHINGAAGAFGGAQAAALAEVVVELEAVAGAELDHGVVGAHTEAVVALEAVTAAEASARLEQRGGLVEAARLPLLPCRRPAPVAPLPLPAAPHPRTD